MPVRRGHDKVFVAIVSGRPDSRPRSEGSRETVK